MPKAVVSNRIYITPGEELAKEIRNQLTYRVEHKVPGRGGVTKTQVEIIRNYKTYANGILSIPQGRFDLIPENTEIVDKRITCDMPFPQPRHPLREGQQKVFDEVTDSCFINALVGWGKTFTALHIAKKLHQKTLVVTHTTMLRDQWIEEVEELFGFKPGVIGSGKYDIDPTIVVGNIQTLTKKQLELSKEFGTIILDEAHHAPATTFSSFVDAMHARYRIGLSGTMTRKDGLHVLFPDYFGHKVFRPPQSHTIDPKVLLVRTGLALPAAEAWATRINKLLYDPDYQEYVAVVAKTQLAKGHKVLIVADRVEFLQRVKEIIGETCVLVTGETSLEERARITEQLETGESSCIAGSRQIFAEGISINILSCLILATPISNPALLEQLAGRIMRQHPNKLDPLLIDLQFSGPTDRKQNNARLSFYLDKGWDVQSL